MMWVIIVYLIYGCIFGFITQYVAESKGYDTGFAWGFWLGVIGLLVVGFRPAIAQQYDPTERNIAPALSENRSAYAPKPVGWECICGSKNPSSVNYCMSCRRSKEEATEERVNCPHCGAKNRKSNAECFACGKSMKKEPVEMSKKDANDAVKSSDYVDVLEKFAKLHDQGILTDEEFQQKKTEILSKM